MLATDPACGARAFLVPASRFIAAAYSQRLFGETTDLTMSIVLPEVMISCIFGMDIDPGAVDLAKAALWIRCAAQRG